MILMPNPSSHRPKKRFGQNFLHDSGVIGRIVAAVSPKVGEHLVEIGPGQGAITAGLLQSGCQLDAIELDRDLIRLLEQQFGRHTGFRLHNADALNFDFCELQCDGPELRVVGNLPYNISTPLLFHLLDQSRCIRDMHFMLQKEVVARMAAAPAPGSKTYGRLSVMLQIRCQVEQLFPIAPGAFNPPPKVDSAFVRLIPYAQLPYPLSDFDLFSRIVTQAFSQRRKTLRNTLKSLVSAEVMEQAGIDPVLRAEQLSPAQFARLSNRVADT